MSADEGRAIDETADRPREEDVFLTLDTTVAAQISHDLTDGSLNVKNKMDRTLLHLAAMWGYSSFCRSLLNAGLENDPTAMYAAAQGGNVDVVIVLVTRGAGADLSGVGHRVRSIQAHMIRYLYGQGVELE